MSDEITDRQLIEDVKTEEWESGGYEGRLIVDLNTRLETALNKVDELERCYTVEVEDLLNQATRLGDERLTADQEREASLAAEIDTTKTLDVCRDDLNTTQARVVELQKELKNINKGCERLSKNSETTIDHLFKGREAAQAKLTVAVERFNQIIKRQRAIHCMQTDCGTIDIAREALADIETIEEGR